MMVVMAMIELQKHHVSYSPLSDGYKSDYENNNKM